MATDSKEPCWYVVHTYSGYENKVKVNLEKTVVNNDMQDLIQDVRVPVEEVIEVKNGKRSVAQRKVFPGYVLVNMRMTNESWYVVRNTRGVTGFVGPESKPIPLTPEEVDNMINTEKKSLEMGIGVGEVVRILSGPLVDFTGKVTEVDALHQKLRVNVEMFGRETPVEVELDQVQKIN